MIQTVSRVANRWAAYSLVLLLPLSVYWPIAPSAAPWALDIFGRPGLYLSDLMIGALLLTSLTDLRRRTGPSAHPYLAPLLALAGLAALTLPTAFVPVLAGYTLVRWLVAVGVYVVLIRSQVSTERLVTILLVGLSFQALIGLGQVLKHGPIGLPGELALQPWQFDAAVIRLNGAVGIPAYGLTFNPNVLGGFLSVGLLLGLPLLAQRGPRIMWWLAWMGLLLTFSRSAWLTTALLMPLAAGWLVWKRLSMRRPLVIASGGAALISFVVGSLCAEQMVASLAPIIPSIGSAVGRLLASNADNMQSLPTLARRSQLLTSGAAGLKPQAPTEQEQAETALDVQAGSPISIAHRVELWKVALGIIQARPLTGIGAGNYPVTVPFVSESLRPNHAHNVPLQLAAEIGVIGGGVWLWMWLGAAVVLYRRRHALNSWAVVSICAWLGLGLIGLYDGYPWVLESGRLLTVIVLSLASRNMEGGPD